MGFQRDPWSPRSASQSLWFKGCPSFPSGSVSPQISAHEAAAAIGGSRAAQAAGTGFSGSGITSAPLGREETTSGNDLKVWNGNLK